MRPRFAGKPFGSARSELGGRVAHHPILATGQGAPPCILAVGEDQVDLTKVSGLLGLPIRKAEAAEVRETTGYVIGGVPPFGHAKPVETLIDKKLLEKDTVWLAAGTPKTVFSLSTGDLRNVTGIETGVDISA